MAGHKGFETATFWIPAIGSLALIWFVKRFWISIPLALAIPIVLLCIQQPYLDWVHGPNSPWPDLNPTSTATPIPTEPQTDGAEE